ncbi:RNA-directed RNA polymerase [Aphelenchoides besseyi]|nr:RNA-directed RNA polymerase [Aphelenchoides besseyi]KAI6193715.1 RNA-directed RNA polymerase [Aphelenchoides besseyi]
MPIPMNSQQCGRMKMVFVTENKQTKIDDFKKLIKSGCKELLIKLKEKLNKGVKLSLSELVEIGGDQDLARIDCCLQVDSQQLYSLMPQLNQLIIEHWRRIRSRSTDLNFQMSIQMQDSSFFDIGKLMGADLQIRSSDIYFGNLIRHDQFLCHYKVDQNPANGWYGDIGLMRHYYNDPHLLDNNSTIFIDFEHDRHRMTIVFPVKSHDVGRDSTKLVNSVAKLDIDYSTIRRIFIDFSTSNQRDFVLNLYLHVRCPPLISIVKFVRRGENGKEVKVNPFDLRTMPGDRSVHFIPMRKDQRAYRREDIRAVSNAPYLKIVFPADNQNKYAHILGRLYAATRKPVEVRGITDMVVPIGERRLNNSTPNSYADVKRIGGTFRIVPKTAEDTDVRFKYKYNDIHDQKWKSKFKHNEKPDFAVFYMFDALMSRGAHVNDQLLVEPTHWDTFLEKVYSYYKENRRLALETLERLLNGAVEHEDMKPLHELFDDALRKAERALAAEHEIRSTGLQRGYVRLRKVTITPTRRIYEAPELIMGNRVLRHDEVKYPTERFLRVSFRDENYKRILPNMGAHFIEQFVKNALYDGIKVAQQYFNYLGSSNSQMRDQGCYFIQGSDKEINECRQALGSFQLNSVPKLMARFGQCFTQSHAMQKDVDRRQYCYIAEWTGGSDGNGEPYTFSDGVGCMSRAFARQIACDMEYGNDFVPSCIQSRFRGNKGVHVVNPNIDKVHAWTKKHGITESTKNSANCWLNVDLQFRPSQNKFETRRPSNVCLNRPMINILDQVSSLQNYNCHIRVTNRIFELLDIQLRQIARWMVDEREARIRLGEFPHVLLFEVLQNVNLTTEPFFRALLRTAARSTLNKLRSKLQIAIPASLGRSMLGVIDESGLLQSGQVFVRYTINIQQKRPGPTAGRRTVTGPIMITKNPMIVSGDVRMFEAVDIPALNHLCDVVVFPRWGPRPHTDEMAGSDLDGDEYSVIWDPGLYLDHNEQAFDYTSQKVASTQVDENKLRTQMADFFMNYITNDSIGKLATAFLVNSDTYGIKSQVCETVAMKHMSAVDFPKTGIPATRLSKEEDPQRKPDYLEQEHKPNYRSQRLNGRLFRRIKDIDAVLESSIEEQLNQQPEMDELIEVDGVTEIHKKIAIANFEKYQATMENMLNRFGISTEVEVFSNSYAAIRKQISDKEEDDMSFFNTRRLIEEELENICALHRRLFFESFEPTGQRWKDLLEKTQRKSKKNERENRLVLLGRIRDPPQELQRLAVAYYKVAYSQPNQKFLSFAWLTADVLAKVRLNRLHALTSQNLPVPRFSFDPLSDHITKHINGFIQHISTAKSDKLAKFRQHLETGRLLDEERAKMAQKKIVMFMNRHVGLDKLLYFCWRWGVKREVVKDYRHRETERPFQFVHEDKPPVSYDIIQLLLTFIQFGLNDFIGAETLDRAFLDEGEGVVNLEEQHGGLGKKFLQFMEFMSTLRFANLRRQTFIKFGYASAFNNSEWVVLHQAAEKTYYQLCYNNSFAVLPHFKNQLPENQIQNTEVANPTQINGESFAFELPLASHNIISDQTRLNMLAYVTGCYDLSFRSLNSRHNEMTARIVATVAGTFDAVNSLRRMLMPWGYINVNLSAKLLDKALSSQVLHNVMHLERNYKKQRSIEHETKYQQPTADTSGFNQTNC